MKTNSQKTNRKIWMGAMISIALVALFAQPQATVAQQWTTTGNDISNANTGNVGVGITIPLYKFDVLSGTSIIARFGSTAAAHNQVLFNAPAGYNSSLTLQNGGVAKWYLGNRASNDRFSFINAGGVTEVFSILSILQNGNVGIGTTGPLAPLHIGAGADANTLASQVYVTANGNTNLAVRDATNNVELINLAYSGGGIIGTFTNHNLVVRTNNADKITVLAAGNVGIGIATPTSKLDVAGNVNATGTINAAGGLKINGALVTSSQWMTSGSNINYATAGNVGIGTTTPTSKLHVTGTGRFTGNLTVDGNIAAKYQDVAEWVPSSEQIASGTVVVLDTNKSNHVVSSDRAYDTRVAGVISEQPGITLGESGAGKVLVATTGRVRVKVDATRGPIKIGDLLVTSDVSGLAMKSEPVNLGGIQLHRPGTIIGKALEPLEKGKGEILVLLSLQ